MIYNFSCWKTPVLSVFILFNFYSFCQSKKEQIENLNQRVDSLSNIPKNNTIHFIRKIDSIGNQ
jgi:hypothetical protein